VTGGLSNLLPKSVALIGVVLALAGELSSFSLLTNLATVLLPITRFGGLLWLIIAAAMLPKRRIVEVENA
jgi:hypothetical protein